MNMNRSRFIDRIGHVNGEEQMHEICVRDPNVYLNMKLGNSKVKFKFCEGYNVMLIRILV